jgi:large subunit ribosomal protein L19
MSEEQKNAENTEETVISNGNDEMVEKEVDSTIPTEEETKDAVAEVLPHDQIRTGMIVRVHERIVDVNAKGEERQRIQIFEGLVMNVRGGGASRTITVRKNAKGWIVEKIYPLSSPNVEKIEVVKQYKVRRANLSFLRGRFRRKMQEMLDKK